MERSIRSSEKRSQPRIQKASRPDGSTGRSLPGGGDSGTLGPGIPGERSGRPVRAVGLFLAKTWRGMAAIRTEDFVVRAGYGIFTSSYRGNITASSIIAPPYWTFESQSWSAAQLQRWETAWPVNPTSFVAPSVGAAAYDVKPTKDHEWNLSVQKSLPFNSALTVSYVGSYGDGLIADNSLNNVPPGLYKNLQAAKPYPAFGSIDLYVNSGKNWYNSGQLKYERRFSKGLSYMLSYAFSKNISENGGDSIWAVPTPFAPAGYNRGIASYNRTHILSANAVWEIPVGRGHQLART